MSVPFTGGCACGAIRYECSAEPLISLNCHCRDCQRISGSAHTSNLGVSKDAFKLTKGQPKFYEFTADSGNRISRGFCPECGSPLFSQSPARDFIGIRASSLDDPSWHQPSMDIYTDSAQPWDYMNPELPKFPKMPQR